MKKTVFLLLIFMVSCFRPSNTVAHEIPLPTGVFSLSSIGPELSDNELAPLQRVIGDATFVALGENTHATEGYSQAKVRMMRFLIEKMGFRTITFENPRGETMVVDDYITSCRGTAAEAAKKGLFRVWQSFTVVDFLEWLCHYNQEHPGDKVRVYGFDVQNPHHDGKTIREFAKKNGFKSSATRVVSSCLCATQTSWYGCVKSPEARGVWDGTAPITQEKYNRCVSGIEAMEKYIQAHEATLIKRTSKKEVDLLQVSLVSLRAFQNQVFNNADGGRTYEERDFGNASVLLRLKKIEFTDSKVIVWAHDDHIAKKHEEFGSEEYRHHYGRRMMGSILADALGSQYVTIGLIGYDIDTHWPGGYPMPRVLPTEANSAALLLHQFGRKYLLIDTRSPIFMPGLRYILTYDPGVSLNPETVPADQFDALLFLDVNPAAKYIGD